MDEFTQGMLDAAFFAEIDDNDEPLSKHFTVDDIAPASLASLERDARRFQKVNAHLLYDADLEKAGMDFWFTRNGHGRGFWDGGWLEPDATELTKASKAFNEANLYVGDDGLLHVSGGTMRFENPLPRLLTGAKLVGGLALLAGAIVAGVEANRASKLSSSVGPYMAAGTQTVVIQAPAGSTAATIQGEIAPVLGTTTAVPFTSIPLALEDPNAATLWSLTVTILQATSLQSLNALLLPIGIAFLSSLAPLTMVVQNSVNVTAGTAVTVTVSTMGSASQPTQADVQAFLTGIGFTNLSALTAPTVSSITGAQTWTAQGTPSKTGPLADLTVSYNGLTQSFSVQSAA